MCIADTLNYDYNIIYKCVSYTENIKFLFIIINLQWNNVRWTICGTLWNTSSGSRVIFIIPECSSTTAQTATSSWCATQKLQMTPYRLTITDIHLREKNIRLVIYESTFYTIISTLLRAEDYWDSTVSRLMSPYAHNLLIPLFCLLIWSKTVQHVIVWHQFGWLTNYNIYKHYTHIYI